MTTPQFQQASVNFNVMSYSENECFIPTKNVNGANVDVTSGWKIVHATLFPASSPNSLNWRAKLVADGSGVLTPGTFEYTSTGVKWKLTMAQTVALQAIVPTLSSTIYLSISNDNGVSETRLGVIRLSLDNPL